MDTATAIMILSGSVLAGVFVLIGHTIRARAEHDALREQRRHNMRMEEIHRDQLRLKHAEESRRMERNRRMVTGNP